MSKKKVLTLKEIFIYVIINMLIFQTPLQNRIAIFQYLDEIIALFMGCYLLINFLMNSKKYFSYELRPILISFMILILGLISNYYSKIQLQIGPIIMDIGNNFKFLLTFFGSMLYLRKLKHRNYLISCLAFTTRFCVFIAFFFSVINIFININMHYDTRFGIRSFQFIFGHAGMLNIACYLWLAILSADLYNGFLNRNSSKKRYIFIFLALLVWCSTLRTRAIILAFCYLITLYFLVKRKRIRINIIKILPVITIAFTFAYPQIEKYFLNSKAPRAILLKYGIETMNEYFPFGSGFSTYGSFAASKYYSKLYFKYGFDRGYGINPYDRQFLTDNYWPSIIAQYGFFGFVLMIVLFISIAIIILRKTKNNSYYRFASMICFCSLLIASTVTTSFSHYTAVSLFFIIPLFFKSSEESI